MKRGFVLRRYRTGIYSMPVASSFQFGSECVGAAPVECEVFELGVSDRCVPGLRVSSFHRIRAPPDPEELSVQHFLDFGDLTPDVLGQVDDTFESIRLSTYEAHPEFRPAVYRLTDD